MDNTSVITVQQWKEFIAYRADIERAVHCSKEWHEMFIASYECGDPYLGIVMDAQLKMIESKIPPKTVEACLDWLATVPEAKRRRKGKIHV